MHIPSFFGLGTQRIVALGVHTAGMVTEVQTCWWLRVNTEPYRTTKNPRYPHIVRFSYEVNGISLNGTFFLNWQNDPPAVGQRFRLFYDPTNPKKFAVPAF